MKYFSTTTSFLNYARRGALLLVLGAAGPAAWGQSFGPASTYSTGVNSGPQSLKLSDVNKDGRLDVVTGNNGSSTIGVLLGLAGGSFAAVTNYPTGQNCFPHDIALGDVNGDGSPDIVTANYNVNTVGVLLGLAGGFVPATNYTTGANNFPVSVALGDVNGDGRLDIVTANSSSTSSVLLGLNGGGFAAVTNYSTGAGSNPYDVTLGDVNRDGRLDIVTANSSSGTVGVLLGQANGGFTTVTTYPTELFSHPQDVVLGDVNGDGQTDIITANNISNTVSVLLGQTSGGFAAAISYSTGPFSNPQDVVLGDVNGDGRPDIVTANNRSSTVGVLLGQVGGGFTTATTYSAELNSGPVAVAVGDVNGDGRPDIMTANISLNTASMLLNTGTFTPLATARPAAADVALYPNPARGSLTVQLPAGTVPGPAELLNSLGQVVRRTAAAAPRFTVETAGLAPGIYTLRVVLGAAGTVARRVVVE